MTMAFDALMPWWALAILTAGAVWIAVRTYTNPVVSLTPRQRALLIGLRASLLLLLVLMLQRPVWLELSTDRRNAVVPILVDVSRSMRLGDADADGKRRIDHAADLVARELVPLLSGAFDVDVLSFGETLAPFEPSAVHADARRSDLSGALDGVRERYRGQAVAGIVIVSDGGDTGGDPDVPRDPDGPPVFAVGVGSATIARDREVLTVTAGAPALLDAIVDLSVSVVSHGFGNAPLEVRLFEDGRLVQIEHVTPAESGAPIPIVFRVSPKRDLATLYTVDIPADHAELTPDNNSRRFLVPPAGRPRRILLVEGAPGHDHAFLKRAWGRDVGIELDSVVRKGENDRGQDTFYIQGDSDRLLVLASGFPQHRQALFFYDTVVLGNVSPEFLSPEQLEMTAAFVAGRGGGLLVLGAQAFAGRGLANTSLEPVLPLSSSGRSAGIASAEASQPYAVVLTADGAHHPIMRLGATSDTTRARWRLAPALAGVAVLGDPRPGASVLAWTVGAARGLHPLVAVQRFGRGRAMVFTGEASWRWKMLMPSDDDTYDTFWRQAVRWLAQTAPDPVTVSVEGGAVADEGARIEVTSRDATYEPVPDASLTVRLTDPTGTVEEVRPALIDAASGRYAARFTPGQSGVYHVEVRADQGAARLGSAETWLLVGGADRELTDPRRNDEALARLAGTTGGLVAQDALAELPDRLRASSADPALSVRHDLWHNVWMFALLVLLPSTEWVLRRQWGMR